MSNDEGKHQERQQERHVSRDDNEPDDDRRTETLEGPGAASGGGGGGQHSGMVEGFRHPRVSETDFSHEGTGETVRTHEDYGYVESKGSPGTDTYRGPEQDYPALRPRRDQEIVAELRLHFRDDATLDSRRIEVESIDGRVVITGTVDDEASVEQVTELCRHVDGVREIDNRLQVD
jgi:osmotically-inducible protein OsmY